MRYIKFFVILSTLLFIMFICNNQRQDYCDYFTSRENYYLEYECQQLDVPVFVDGSSCIFKSDSIDYYLLFSDAKIKIKKKSVKAFDSQKAFRKDITCYILSFETNLDENMIYPNAKLEVIYNNEVLTLELGNITVLKYSEKVNVIELSNNSQNGFYLNQVFLVLDQLDFKNIFNDIDNTKTYFEIERPNKMLYSFVYLADGSKEIGIIIDKNYSLLSLELKEGYYDKN